MVGRIASAFTVPSRRSVSRLFSAVFGVLGHGKNVPPRRRTILGVEQVEERAVPATFLWKGYSGIDIDFSTKQNWLENGGAATRAPAAGDDIYFDGSQTMTDCMNMVGDPGGAYASVHLVNYFVNVYLAGSITTDDLELAGGWIRNTANGQDITVTNSLNWTADVLGGQRWDGMQFTGTLHVDGATAAFAPVGAGIITSGDTISFENGATGTFADGEYDFTDGDGIVVNSTCSAEMDAGAASITMNSKVSNGPQLISVPTGGELYAKRAAGYALTGEITSNMPISVTGGIVALFDNVAVTVDGHVGGGTGPSYQQTGGRTELHNDSYLTVNNGFSMSGGTLTTVNAATGNKRGTILGNATISGGEITVDLGRTTAHTFGELRVVGNVTWSGGVYRPLVDGTVGSSACDLWRVTGTMTITATGATGAQLGPPPPLNNPGNLTGRFWNVIQVDGGATYGQGVQPLGFETAAEAAVWAATLVNQNTVFQLQRTQP